MKGREQVDALFRRDARSGVRDEQLNAGFGGVDGQMNPALGVVVFNGIGEQVEDDLPEFLAVGSDVTRGGREGEFDLDGFFGRERLEEVDAGLEEARHFHGFQKKFHLEGLDPRDLEHLVDEAEQVLSGP